MELGKLNEAIAKAAYELMIDSPAKDADAVKRTWTGRSTPKRDALLAKEREVEQGTEAKKVENATLHFQDVVGWNELNAASMLMGDEMARLSVYKVKDKQEYMVHKTTYDGSFDKLSSGVKGFWRDYHSAITTENFDNTMKSLKAVTAKLTPEQFEKIVKEQVEGMREYYVDDIIEKLGFEGIAEQNIDKAVVEAEVNRALEDYIDERVHTFKQHHAAAQHAVEQMEVVSLYTGKDGAPGDKGYIVSILADDDPVRYAKTKKYQIAGQDPIEWAVHNDKKIDGKDPIAYALGARKVDKAAIVELAVKNNKTVHGQDIGSYLLDKGIRINGQHPAKFLIENEIKADGKDAIVYMSEHNIKVGRQSATEWAITQGYIDAPEPEQYSFADEYPVASMSEKEKMVTLKDKIKAHDAKDGLHPILDIIDEGKREEIDAAVTMVVESTEIQVAVLKALLEAYMQEMENKNKSTTIARNIAYTYNAIAKGISKDNFIDADNTHGLLRTKSNILVAKIDNALAETKDNTQMNPAQAAQKTASIDKLVDGIMTHCSIEVVAKFMKAKSAEDSIFMPLYKLAEVILNLVGARDVAQEEQALGQIIQKGMDTIKETPVTHVEVATTGTQASLSIE